MNVVWGMKRRGPETNETMFVSIFHARKFREKVEDESESDNL